MPLFMFDTDLLEDHRCVAVERIARDRYPEVAIRHRYAAHDPADGVVWVCTAPSVAHVTDWAAAADIELHDLHQIHED